MKLHCFKILNLTNRALVIKRKMCHREKKHKNELISVPCCNAEEGSKLITGKFEKPHHIKNNNCPFE
jgi:hypothetical protein